MAAATDIQTWRERRDRGTSDDAIDLTRFWREHEAAIGIRSNFGAMLSALEGMTVGSGPPAGWDPHAEHIEAIGRCRRTWQTLRVMDDRRQILEIVVLHRLYGDVLIPEEVRDAFGALGQIAALTDAAEGARAALAAARGLERESVVVGATAVAEGQARLLRDIAGAVASADRVVTQIEALDRLIERDRTTERTGTGAQQAAARPGRRADLARRLTGWDTHIATLEKSARCDGVLRAQHSALANEDAATTAAEAVVHMLHLGGKDSDERAAFVSAVSDDARALKDRAHAAYTSAKAARP